MSIWRQLLVKICIVQKLLILVMRNSGFHMVQDFTEMCLRAGFDYFYFFSEPFFTQKEKMKKNIQQYPTEYM